jgi:hypothetical protein
MTACWRIWTGRAGCWRTPIPEKNMTLRDFQRALSDMTLDTRITKAVRRNGTPALSDYELTSLEQNRLVDVARQPGMDLNCTLARGNRFQPIVEMFPLTCELLKPALRLLLDELWNRHRPDNYQLTGEDEVFAAFLEEKIAGGELTHPYAAEVFRYERVCMDLAKSLRYVAAEDLPAAGSEPFRLAHFRHDPQILLHALENQQMPPAGLPEGNYPVRITLRGDALDVELDEYSS